MSRIPTWMVYHQRLFDLDGSGGCCCCKWFSQNTGQPSNLWKEEMITNLWMWSLLNDLYLAIEQLSLNYGPQARFGVWRKHLPCRCAANYLATRSGQGDTLGRYICLEILVQGLLGCWNNRRNCPEHLLVLIWWQDDWQCSQMVGAPQAREGSFVSSLQFGDNWHRAKRELQNGNTLFQNIYTPKNAQKYWINSLLSWESLPITRSPTSADAMRKRATLKSHSCLLKLMQADSQ